MSMQRRFTPRPSVNTRSANSDGRTITGYAAVFHRAGDSGTEYELAPGVKERIASGAFARALREKHDVSGVLNHDPSLLLGATWSGTLRLETDTRGLRYDIDAPDTQTGRDVVALLKRGDLRGSSFAFFITRSSWIEGRDEDVRVVEDLDLVDVGPVTRPAYTGTTSGLRAVGHVDSDILDRSRRRQSRAVQVYVPGHLQAHMLRARLAGL